jgi:hypothetical protein
MPSKGVNQVFNNVDDGFAAVFDALRAGNETTARIYRYTIDELERSTQERTELARQWAESPYDVIGLSRSVLETWRMRAQRRAGLARSFLGEAVNAGREARYAVNTVVQGSRDSAETGLAAARRTAQGAGDDLRRGVKEAVERAGVAVNNGGTEVRKAVDNAASTVNQTVKKAQSTTSNGAARKTSTPSRKSTGGSNSSRSRRSSGTTRRRSSGR